MQLELIGWDRRRYVAYVANNNVISESYTIHDSLYALNNGRLSV